MYVHNILHNKIFNISLTNPNIYHVLVYKYPKLTLYNLFNSDAINEK